MAIIIGVIAVVMLAVFFAIWTAGSGENYARRVICLLIGLGISAGMYFGGSYAVGFHAVWVDYELRNFGIALILCGVVYALSCLLASIKLSRKICPECGARKEKAQARCKSCEARKQGIEREKKRDEQELIIQKELAERDRQRAEQNAEKERRKAERKAFQTRFESEHPEIKVAKKIIYRKYRYSTILYTLKLDFGHYYVGVTKRFMGRMIDHFSGEGAVWTKKHPPLELISIIVLSNLNPRKEADWERALEFEDYQTVMMMKEYGIPRVRGGNFSFFKKEAVMKRLAELGWDVKSDFMIEMKFRKDESALAGDFRAYKDILPEAIAKANEPEDPEEDEEPEDEETAEES
jgi:predicted GIY-YIG superfamily endonuclease